MHIRNKLFLFLICCLTLPLTAQEFVVLKWQAVDRQPVLTECGESVFTFEGAQFRPESKLPHYYHQIALEDNYSQYLYDVKVEYPEFQNLTKKESDLLVALGETVPDYPEVESHVSISAKKEFLTASFVPLVYQNGQYKRIVSFKLTVTKTLNRQRAAAAPLHSFAERSKMASGKWVKIRVADAGVYRITHAELSSMGFSNPAKVKLYGYGGRLLAEDFRKSKIDDLPEIPLWRESDYLLFYANGTVSWSNSGNKRFAHTQNYCSTHSYYFLAETEGAPLTFPVEKSLPASQNVITVFDDYALYEKDEFNWANSGRELYDSYNYGSGNKKVYSFDIPGIVNDSLWISVDFSAYSLGTGNTKFNVSINGFDCGSGSIFAGGQYSKANTAMIEKLWMGNKSEKIAVTITHDRPAGSPGRLNFIRLNYKRQLSLYGSSTTFRSRASRDRTSTFVLSKANDRVKVWDVTLPGDYKQLEGSLSGTDYSFTVNSPSLREFVAVDVKGTHSKVEVVGEVSNQNLHALRDIDMVIITLPKSEFIAQAERLAEYHRSMDSLTVQVVTSEQVYNEFSSGTPDLTAYRWFMKMLYDTSTSRSLKYLLLFGDCSYDNRLLTEAWKGYKQSDFLLSYQSPNSVSEVDSYVTDDYFGFLDDNEGLSLGYELIDIGIGRFPVRSALEAKQMVDKTIAYMENKELGPWKNTVCYAADDNLDSGGNEHEILANGVAVLTERNNPELLVNRIFLDSYRRETTSTGYTYKQATKRLLELFDQGMLVVNYTGHSGVAGWSGKKLLTTEDIIKLRSPRAPIWLTASCDFTRYDDSENSAGDCAFLNPKGGAIALLSTSRTVYAGSEFTSIGYMFTKHVFSKPKGKRLRLGDVVRLTKLDADKGVNSLKYNLLGDPALTLAYADDYRVVVDSFAGKPAAATDLMISAGGRVTVTGRIVDAKGQTVEDYHGTIHPTVLDNVEDVTTLNNSGMENGFFTYQQRSKTLFTGSDSIRSGKFSFTFPVPIDINYSNKGGMLNLYASEAIQRREAQGYFDRFLVGGTDPGVNLKDTLGPRITELYLNSPSFTYGGKTNETPYLVAKLEDTDGINTSGTGVGHDLVAIIDNDSRYTYILNRYYQAEIGDYTKGTICYSFPELPEGKHTLLFRAWDICNNSSTATLAFEVVKGLKPGLFDVQCTNSPARDHTRFILSHDRPQALIDVMITVCDFSGRELWSYTETGMSENNYYNVDWDLRSNTGQPLAPGVYIYRASITSGGSKESTQARKIVILAQ